MSTKAKIIVNREKATSRGEICLDYFRGAFSKAYERTGRLIIDFDAKTVRYHKNGVMILTVDDTNSELETDLNENQVMWIRCIKWNILADAIFAFLQNDQ